MRHAYYKTAVEAEFSEICDEDAEIARIDYLEKEKHLKLLLQVTWAPLRVKANTSPHRLSPRRG